MGGWGSVLGRDFGDDMCLEGEDIMASSFGE